MADVTLYLHPGLATGSNNGTSEANAWQSWSDALTGLTSAYPNITATTQNSIAGTSQSVDVIVLGGNVTLTHTTAISIGVISNSTYPLRFVANPATAAPGTWDTGKPMLTYAPSAAGTCFNFGAVVDVEHYVEFVDMQFAYTPTYQGASSSRCIYNNAAKAAGSRMVLKNCHVKGNDCTAGFKSFVHANSNNMLVVAHNCIFEDFTFSGTATDNSPLRCTRAASEGVSEAYNCTFINCDTCVYAGTNNWRIVNCLFSSCVAVLGAGSVATGTGKNAANDALSLPGSDNTTSATFSFVSSTDRHLTAANTYGAGPSDGTYGSYVPTTDIDGDTRSGTTATVGADEVTGGSGGATASTKMAFYRMLRAA